MVVYDAWHSLVYRMKGGPGLYATSIFSKICMEKRLKWWNPSLLSKYKRCKIGNIEFIVFWKVLKGGCLRFEVKHISCNLVLYIRKS